MAMDNSEAIPEKGLTEGICTLYNITCIYNHVKTVMETVSRRHLTQTEKISNASESREQVEARCK